MTKLIPLKTLTALGTAAVLGAISPTLTLIVAGHAILLAGGIAVVRAVEPRRIRI